MGHVPPPSAQRAIQRQTTKGTIPKGESRGNLTREARIARGARRLPQFPSWSYHTTIILDEIADLLNSTYAMSRINRDWGALMRQQRHLATEYLAATNMPGAVAQGTILRNIDFMAKGFCNRTRATNISVNEETSVPKRAERRRRRSRRDCRLPSGRSLYVGQLCRGSPPLVQLRSVHLAVHAKLAVAVIAFEVPAAPRTRPGRPAPAPRRDLGRRGLRRRRPQADQHHPSAAIHAPAFLQLNVPTQKAGATPAPPDMRHSPHILLHHSLLKRGAINPPPKTCPIIESGTAGMICCQKGFPFWQQIMPRLRSPPPTPPDAPGATPGSPRTPPQDG